MKLVYKKNMISDTVGEMSGANSESDGTAGLVPAPLINDRDKFLKGDGTWGKAGSGAEPYITTLTAGSTSVVFEGISFTTKSFIQVATSEEGMEFNSITKSNLVNSDGALTADFTVTFDEQDKDIIVALLITELPVPDIDSITVVSSPTTTTYMEGDTLNTTGIRVKAVIGELTQDITDMCTYSPTTLNTAGTQEITVSYGDVTTTFNVTVEAIIDISVTTPPTKTTYKTGDTLDLTGIAVTASSANLTKDVTSSCTFSPADGTTITTEGTFNITATWQGFTDTQQYVVSNVITTGVYGATWAGTSDPSWTRTDDAESFSDPQPYYSGMSDTPSSPFDEIMPWAGMKIEEDTDLGTLVKIPKFWYKWTRSSSSMKLQVSPEQQTGTGWHVSPAHADRGDGSGERDVVYVGRYHCAASTYKSTSGVLPQVSVTRDTARTAISNLHAKAWQYDFAMWWTINMLYLVEFANWNSQAKIGGGCSETESTSSDVYNMGSTDSMPYHTGTVASSIGAAVYGATQYRHIENLWGNCFDWIDGIYFSGTDVYAINNPANFSDTTGGTLVGARVIAGGVVTEWTVPSASGFEYALYPAANTTDSNYETYNCDPCVSSSSGVVLLGGGNYSGDQRRGAFYLYDGTTSYTYTSLGSRLQKLP